MSSELPVTTCANLGAPKEIDLASKLIDGMMVGGMRESFMTSIATC